MKKIKLFILGFVATVSLNASGQAIQEGNVIVDGYYGFPNIFAIIFANNYGVDNAKAVGVGPLGVRAEYLLTDNVGLGVDVGYSSAKLNFSTNAYSYYDNQVYDYELYTQKIGVMVTFNYHFLDNDKVDFYGVLGAGYKNRTATAESNNPNWNREPWETVIPVASRLGLGLRYFFTPNLGANLAIGAGQGGLINAGVSVKF